MPVPQDDVASRCEFVIGDDLMVGPHDASPSAWPIAGLALMFMLALHDSDVRGGHPIHLQAHGGC